MSTADLAKPRGTAGPRFFIPIDGNDLRPGTIAFPTKWAVSRSSVIESSPVLITGSGGPYTMSIDQGEYSLNGGAWTGYGTEMSVRIGDTLRLRNTSSASYATTVTTTLSLGATAVATWGLVTVGAPQAIAGNYDGWMLTDGLFGRWLLSTRRRR